MAFPHAGVSRSYGSHASFAHFIPTSSPSSNIRDGGRGCIYHSKNEMERNRACSLSLTPFSFKSNGRTVKRRFLTSFSLSSSASASSTVEKSIMDAESNLIDALIGIQGRGRGISVVLLEDISQAVQSLESLVGVEEPTRSALIEGTWRLMFTTRPGTASPIQRAFVGVDTFSVFQEIQLQETVDQRVTNIVRFSEAIGELKVEAAASVANASRILFQFDRAAFSFKFLPFKVPYPVPFRLLGDEAKGWLETTYLSPSGNIRISKGNKGTTFVLQKQISKRQQLLQAVSSGVGVEKIVEKLIDENPTKNPADLQHLAGKWRLIWSSQGADANWLQKSTIGFPNWQIVEAETGRLQNVVQFFPGLKLRARARSQATSLQRRDVNIEGASLEVGSLSVPLKIMGAGFTEVLYLDKKIRITRGDRGSTFIHIRDD
ncbi:hypothetical protein KP509_18G084800 [Ceratopteris richardii]|uniref:Plastid lipid-associated protein/fibrillin conserved domain-containing protein n=1 Tax=Ceratopteris richardii TaxID=49495 RepID=A0A8T2STR1_CERRI|nr:hypothetical protein KP509_18G084800 [Ceratopteris richardii]